MAHHQKRSIGMAVMGGLAGLLGSYIAYLLLGFFTGVVAMCSWAPEWWIHAYFALAVIVPVCGIWLAVKARRSYLQRHEGAGA